MNQNSLKNKNQIFTNNNTLQFIEKKKSKFPLITWSQLKYLLVFFVTFITLLTLLLVNKHLINESDYLRLDIIKYDLSKLEIEGRILSIKVEIETINQQINDLETKEDKQALLNRLFEKDYSKYKEDIILLKKQKKYIEVFYSSVILKSPTYAEQLFTVVNSSLQLSQFNPRVRLLYRATRDGDNISHLLKKIINKPNIVFVIENLDSIVFGAFLSKPVTDPDGNKDDSKALIFSFNPIRTYPIISGSQSYRYNDGVFFSIGFDDIHLVQFFLGRGSSKIGLPGCYGDKRLPNVSQYFTRYLDNRLYIKDIEVFSFDVE